MRPQLSRAVSARGDADWLWAVLAEHHSLGAYTLAGEGRPTLLFTENDTNAERLYRAPTYPPYVKDGINDAVVDGRTGAVNPAEPGTRLPHTTS